MTTSVFVGHSASWVPDEAVAARVKLAALLYDRLIFSFGTLRHFANTWAEVNVEPALSESDLRRLDELSADRPMGAPDFDIYGLPDRPIWKEPRTGFDLALTESILSLGGNPREHNEHEKWLLYTKSEVLYWRTYLPDSVFVGGEAAQRALRIAAMTHPSNKPITDVEAPCPQVSGLAWKDIVSLRDSPYLVAFRKMLLPLLQKTNTAELQELYLRSLERLADEVAPSTGRALAVAVLSNLPIPIVNPFHVGHNVHEIWHQTHMKGQFGWLFFIREAAKLASDRQQNDA